MARNVLSILRKQRRALDRAIRALEQFQQITQAAQRKRQEPGARPPGAKVLRMNPRPQFRHKGTAQQPLPNRENG